jgi:hypothetical protein
MKLCLTLHQLLIYFLQTVEKVGRKSTFSKRNSNCPCYQHWQFFYFRRKYTHLFKKTKKNGKKVNF